MNDHLFGLRLFLRVARKGSFSAAGREMNIPQPTVSRIIAQLEKSVGAALLIRTTRAVSLTEAGTDFMARLEPILAALDEAEQAARGADELRGVLRVGVSSSFAIRGVVPRLPVFLERHPELKVELLMDDQRQDLVIEGVDIALRFGPLPDSSALAKRIGSTPRIVAAAPGYLARAGVPQLPADLATHSVIVGPSLAGHVWSFQHDGTVVSVRVDGKLSVSLSEVSTVAAVAGLGIVSMSLAGCIKEIEDGTLVRILPEWDMGTIEVNAVFAAGRAAKPSARAFADFLIEELDGPILNTCAT
ncbi:MAG: LysR family transcriptional regulator [Pseudomonas sp.]